MRESGFDINFHFGPFGGSTHHYAAVGLNSLLYRYELDLEDFARQLGKTADAERWTREARARKEAIDRYLWRPDAGHVRGLRFHGGKPSTSPYLTTFYPLVGRCRFGPQAASLREKLPLFERRGGLSME